jgi:hypothetical protein
MFLVLRFMMLLNSKHFLSSKNIFEVFCIIMKINYRNKIFKLVLADGFNTVSVLKKSCIKSMGNRWNIVRYKEISYKGEDS